MPRNPLGQQGELLACEFLKKNEYEILAKNYFTRQGELDIIARQKDELVFVEVKTRRNKKFGSAAEAVTRKKRQHVMFAALTYLKAESPIYGSYRFDVIEVYIDPAGQLTELNHIVEAFTYE